MSIELAPDSNPWSDWLKKERETAGGGIAMTPTGGEAWIPPGASFGDDTSGQVNRQNPWADPGKAFVQGGTTGGYIDNIGVTVGQGRSITPEQAQAQIHGAQESGISQDWIQDYLRRNPLDTNRLQEAYRNENVDTTGNGAKNPWDAINGRFGAGGGTGQSWSGNWFDDPANSQLETVIKNQLNQLTNPGAQDPQSQLMGFLMKRFQELSTSNGYSPEELALLNTQGLEPIEALRKSAQQRELERTASRGFLPTSGLTRLNQQQNDVDYDRMRTAASRDLAVQNVNERTNRLNQALQLGQTALNTQRGTNTNQLQLATLLQQMPRQAMLDALNVFSQSGSPDSLAGLVSQITSNANRDSYLNQQQNLQNFSAIGQLIAELFG